MSKTSRIIRELREELDTMTRDMTGRIGSLSDSVNKQNTEDAISNEVIRYTVAQADGLEDRLIKDYLDARERMKEQEQKRPKDEGHWELLDTRGPPIYISPPSPQGMSWQDEHHTLKEEVHKFENMYKFLYKRPITDSIIDAYRKRVSE